MAKNLLLIGGGGHCKSVIETLYKNNCYSKVGIVDLSNNCKVILDVPYLGSDEDLPKLLKMGYTCAFISKGSIGDAAIRERLFNLAKNNGFEMVSLMDSSAVVSEYATIEAGCFIGKGALINAGAVVKTGAIVNTGAIVEHDCIIDRFAHLASGVVLGGNVTIGERAHIGSGAVIRQGLTIGADALVGIGSVVTKSLESGVTAYGNPCRVVKTNRR